MFCEEVEGGKVAVERIRKLSSECVKRDKVVVERVHKLMHQGSCKSLPKQAQFTRQSQVCCTYNANAKLKFRKT
jgi:uncharacterized protein YoaH (UPF0181 family)